MNVALIGSGGREHSIAIAVSKSKSLSKLYMLPGNPGMEQLGECLNLNVKHQNAVLGFCKENKIDLVIIGPEQPLVDGLSNLLRENDINVFGPSKKAAMIEGDKVFSKNLMKKYNIPTAEYKVFNSNQINSAVEYLDSVDFPIVIKASGLAAGKGVLICENKEDAVKGLTKIMEDKVFGNAGNEVVIEEFMEGDEASIFAITDGKDFISLPAAQDHKRAFDGDKGKNTGGMGAYAPTPLITHELLELIEKTIIQPTIDAMNSENIPYSGCLYCGLMITTNGPKVVEFNCRFGDPETQVVLPLLEGDFLKLLYSSAIGEIDKNAIKYIGGASVCVVAASTGYPGAYEKGLEITGLESQTESVIVYHAGTKRIDNKIVTSGGRVLGVTSIIKENDLTKAKTIAYEALGKINFDGIFFRNDISDKAKKYH